MSTMDELEERNQLLLWEHMARTPIPLELPFSLAKSGADDKDHKKAPGLVSTTDGSTLPELGPLQDMQFASWTDVASTIVAYVFQRTNYDAISMEQNPAAFALFKLLLGAFPYWLDRDYSLNGRYVNISSKDFRQAIDAITDLMDGMVTPVGLKTITDGVRQLATLATNNGEKLQKDDMFEQNSVCIRDGKLYVVFLYTRVEMMRRTGKGYDALEQKLLIVRSRGSLRFDFCKRNADYIQKMDKKILEEWRPQFPSSNMPPNSNPGWPT